MAKGQKSDLVEAFDTARVRPPGDGEIPGVEGPGVDKIRELLFGNQMQDYERRFSQMEQRFLARINEIESEMGRGLAALEASTKKLVDSLAGQLREEKEQRADGDKENDRAQRESAQALERRLRALSDQVSQLERDLTGRIGQEAGELRDEIKRRNQELHYALESMFGDLSNVKTDRNLLAGLFLEVAKCLNQEPKNGARGGEALRTLPAG